MALRVLHATDHYHPHFSGHAVAVGAWVHQLAQRGHQVCLVADHVGGSEAGDGIEYLAVPRWPLLPPSHLLAATRPYGPGFRKALEGFEPDIIHLHGYGPLCQQVARSFPQVPWVATVHSLPQHVTVRYLPGIHTLLWRQMMAFYGRCRKVVAPSDFVVGQLRAHGLEPKAIRMIPSGVDLARFRPTGESEREQLKRRRNWARPTVAYLGRLSPEKGLGTFIELAGRHPTIHWLAIGAGPVTLPETVEQLPCLPQQQVAEVLRVVDLVYVPSISETQGLIVIEALASGTPVVVPAGTATAELAHEGVNGFLYPAGDLEAAEAAIEQALQLERSSIAGTVQELAWDRVVGRMEALYAELNV